VKHFEEAFEPIDCEELIKEKSFDAYCQSLLQRMEQTESEYSVGDRGLIVRLDPNTYRTQIYISESLGEHRMSLGHYPQIPGHPGGTRMYQNIRREEFWSRMAIEIHLFLQNCASCAIKRLVTQRKTTYLKLFPPSAPLEFVAKDVPMPLPKTKTIYPNWHIMELILFISFSNCLPLVVLNQVFTTAYHHHTNV
jgi:hypothetical protein